MNKRLAFIILVAAQLFVPSWMIASQENILNKGVAYKFKTAPVDPYDIFRGRYVSLATDQRSVVMEDSKNIDHGQKIYVIVENGSDGYAQIKSATLDKPANDNYIKTKVSYRSDKEVYFTLPFDRYYMNEKKAPQAEALYRKSNIRGKQNSYVIVRVLNGNALIEGLYVGGKSIDSYFK